MLKKIYIRKIGVATLALFALLLLYLMPEKEDYEYSITDGDIEYVYNNSEEEIYLLDTNDYIARTVISGCDCNTEETILDVVEGLIIDGKKSAEIPNGFRSIIPSGTEVLDLELSEDNVLTINFSQELLDINYEYEDKMIESIIYTLTSIDGIDKVIIEVEGVVLDKLPNSGKSLPSSLDRSYGINKSYDLVSTIDISSYTVYYVSSYNDNNYYVPVTKYVNSDTKDKVKIIIDELSSSPIYEENLMSYLNSNTSLIDYTVEDDVAKLNFDESIYTDEDSILEEVVYTISLSLEDNYNVKEVDFLVNDEEIYKNVLKSIE